MKRLFAGVLTLFLVLSGCTGSASEIDRALALRSRLVSANCCRFDTEVTADFGDQLYTFAMSCEADSTGKVNFSVTEPESIAGITGTISQVGGQLTFDGAALAFELLANDRFSPVSAPWVLIHTLMSGYITSCAGSDKGLLLYIDDSYEDDALNLTVWLDQNDQPTAAEISWQGRRILSMTVSNFTIE